MVLELRMQYASLSGRAFHLLTATKYTHVSDLKKDNYQIHPQSILLGFKLRADSNLTMIMVDVAYDEFYLQWSKVDRVVVLIGTLPIRNL